MNGMVKWKAPINLLGPTIQIFGPDLPCITFTLLVFLSGSKKEKV